MTKASGMEACFVAVLFATGCAGTRPGPDCGRDATAQAPARTEEHEGNRRPPRIVFMGDSITDGFSYPLLVKQALEEAGRPVPVCVNAGIGGDTAEGMRKRLERDVLVHHPDLVTLSVGINDVLRKVALGEYEADVRAVLERIKQAGVPMIVLTTSVLGGKTAEADERLAGHNEILRRLAGEFGHPVTEVYGCMDEARKGGARLLEEDHVHPNYEGHRLIARALLDALGHGDVPVPAEMKVEMLPGVVTRWKVRAAGDGPALDGKSAAAVRPDETWKSLALPEPEEKGQHWWWDQVRRRGYALSLEKLCGKGPRYLGYATVHSDETREVFFNVGAGLQTIWLVGADGEACRAYEASPEWRGFHAGRERIPARLRRGENVIAIETGNQFFLSVTSIAADDTW